MYIFLYANNILLSRARIFSQYLLILEMVQPLRLSNLLNDVKFFTTFMKYFLGLDLNAGLMPGYR